MSDNPEATALGPSSQGTLSFPDAARGLKIASLHSLPLGGRADGKAQPRQAGRQAAALQPPAPGQASPSTRGSCFRYYGSTAGSSVTSSGCHLCSTPHSGSLQCAVSRGRQASEAPGRGDSLPRAPSLWAVLLPWSLTQGVGLSCHQGEKEAPPLTPQCPSIDNKGHTPCPFPVSYTHLTLPTNCAVCRSRWSPYH